MKEEKKNDGLAVASLILGIIGLCTSFIPIINNLSFVMAVVAFVLAIAALSKKSKIGMAIISIVLAFFTVVFTIGAQQTFSDAIDNTSKQVDKVLGNSTEEILANDVEVEMGNFEINEDSYGFKDSELKVKVTNKTSEKKSFTIHIEAVDANGSRIKDDYIYANDLAAGQSQEFKTFQLLTSENIEKCKDATFKIVECSMF